MKPMSYKLKPIKAPLKWKSLEAHDLANATEFGVGIDMEKKVADIKANGCPADEKVVLYKKRIGDGRHLLSACKEADVVPNFAEFLGTEEEFRQFIYRRKILRQHLNPTQAAQAALKLANSNAEAAEMSNASPRTVQSVAKVEQEGSQALKDAMADGTLRASDAEKLLKEEPAIQKAAIKSVASGEARTAIGAVEAICPRCRRLGKPVPNCKQCARLKEKQRRKEIKRKVKAAPSGQLDDFKNEIPKGRRDAYCDPFIQERIDLYGQVGELLRKARTADGLNKRKKFYPFLETKKVMDVDGFMIQQCDEQIERLKAGRPAGVCLECEGSGCSQCKRAGMLPRAEYLKMKEKRSKAKPSKNGKA